jgi:hypothetical protein
MLLLRDNTRLGRVVVGSEPNVTLGMHVQGVIEAGNGRILL